MIEIIPAIDIIEGRCVRLTQGDYANVTEYRESPDEMARRMADHGISRIHVVDLGGAKAGRPINLTALESIARAVDGITIEWGGGIKTADDVHSAFDAGATCVIGGSVAVKDTHLFKSWIDTFSPSRIILGADARDGKVAVSGWIETTEDTVDDVIDRFIPSGISQVIVTDIAKDGMLQGPNIELYTRLQTKYPDVNITVSGGISCVQDIMALDAAGLRRVIVGKALYEGRITLQEITRLIVM